MRSDFNIHESEDTLLFRVRQGRRKFEAALSIAVAFAFAFVVLRHVLSPLFVAMSAVLLSILSVISVLSASWAELRVTMEGFESRGTFGERLRSTTTIPSSEVRWIEYQDDTTGPETAHHPGGLYAVTIRRNVCILPYVDEKETATVIELIARKFPQFSKNWERSGPFGGHFTTLKLDD